MEPTQLRWMQPGQLRILLHGQILSLLLAATGIFSQALANKKLNAPSFQSCLNYTLLSFLLLKRCWQAERPLALPWWKYFLVAVLDVEGNYLIVRAYAEGVSITSATLLDCFTIPNVMILSRICFKTKFEGNHMAGVVFCRSTQFFSRIPHWLSSLSLSQNGYGIH